MLRSPPALQKFDPDELLVVVGPTASGKTALATHLARHWDAEIVGADSVQIYRGFDIGSGKPTEAELRGVRHHLLDVADPTDDFDAARFVTMADAAIADIRARGRRAIVCGGTYLWVKALLEGLAEAPAGSQELRAELRAEARARGPLAMHQSLVAIDPATAARLHPNDELRVLRALEVHRLTGKPLSAFHQEHGFRSRRYHARRVALAWSKEALLARVERRVQAMLDAGWVDEVAGLVARGYGDTRPMRSVGYFEVHEHVCGRLPADALVERIVRSTKVFARRQRTWLAHADIEWLEGECLSRSEAS